MPIKLDCPRCKTPLQVPSKLAGGYVNCPHCKGRLWVSKDAAAEQTPTGPLAVPPLRGAAAGLPGKAAAGPSGATAGLPGSEEGTVGPANRGTQAAAGLPSKAVAGAPEPPPPSPPAKKVARFITAESADSTLRLAADGKLPELQLDAGALKQKPEAKSTSMNPLALLGILCVSAVLSIGLALLGPESQSDPRSDTKDQQRFLIERDFFGSGNIDNSELEPYQVLLREAQRAHTRGDRKAERDCYRRVLDMLRAERGPDRKGLTGSRRRDKQLEQAISVLLSGV